MTIAHSPQLQDDSEGDRLPPSLPPVIDAHVHLFPDPIFSAIWRWFDTHAWAIRYRFTAVETVDFLLSKGVRHMVGLHYAHKPGIARSMNRFMAELCRQRPAITGLATVFPGEEGAATILEESFELGLSGVKLHSHVQCCDMAGEGVEEVCAVCAAHDKPLVAHASREPTSSKYRCDPYELCSADKVQRLLETHPKLKMCVPHLGYGEFEAYRRMLERFDNLWTDTTMMLTSFFPVENQPPLTSLRADRILYGTDFPQIPYAWDREIRALCELGLPEETLERILWRNAVELFGIDGLGSAGEDG